MTNDKIKTEVLKEIKREMEYPECRKKHPEFVRWETKEWKLIDGKEIHPLICDKCNLLWYEEHYPNLETVKAIDLTIKKCNERDIPENVEEFNEAEQKIRADERKKCREEFEKEILELKNDNSFKDNRIEKQDELIIFWQDKYQKIIDKIKKLQIWDRKNIPCDDTEVIRYDDLQQLLSEIEENSKGSGIYETK